MRWCLRLPRLPFPPSLPYFSFLSSLRHSSSSSSPSLSPSPSPSPSPSAREESVHRSPRTGLVLSRQGSLPPPARDVDQAALGAFSKIWWAGAATDPAACFSSSVDDHLERFLRLHPQKSILERLVADAFTSFGVSTMWLGTHAASLLTPGLIRGLAGDAPVSSALDVGAGGGHAIDALVASGLLAEGGQIHATDVAWPVVNKLSRKEAVSVAVQTDQLASEPLSGPGLFPSYDLVFCLNVLDRCELPVTMLNSIARKIATTGGVAIVSVRLPLDAYVWTPRGDVQPQREGGLMDACFRQEFSEGSGALMAWIEGISPLRVCRATRWPYLIQGHAEPFTSLDNLVVVLKHV